MCRVMSIYKCLLAFGYPSYTMIEIIHTFYFLCSDSQFDMIIIMKPPGGVMFNEKDNDNRVNHPD